MLRTFAAKSFTKLDCNTSSFVSTGAAGPAPTGLLADVANADAPPRLL